MVTSISIMCRTRIAFSGHMYIVLGGLLASGSRLGDLVHYIVHDHNVDMPISYQLV